MTLEMKASDTLNTPFPYLTSQVGGILQGLVYLTVLQVILWLLSLHLLIKLLVVLHLEKGAGHAQVKVSRSPCIFMYRRTQ